MTNNDEVARLYMKGLSLSAIAQRAGVHTTTVSRVAKKHGISNRCNGSKKKKIIELKNNGASNSEIAHNVSCHINYVHKVVRLCGL